MPRLLAVLFALTVVAWLVLTALSFPDWLPEAVDPLGYNTLILHALTLAPFVPLALALRLHDRERWSWGGAALVAAVPLGLYSALAFVAVPFGLFSDWSELASNAAQLYALFGIALAAVYGIGFALARSITRHPAA